MLISREVIKEIKDRVDIVSVVREYVHSLKKTGKNWIGLCPFHNDKSPSFSVSEDYGIYKCFACGESGDVIKFIEKIEGLDFAESAAYLAKKCGVDISLEKENTASSFKRKDELVSFNERIIKLFQHFLLEMKEGQVALNYLFNRNIDKDIIDIFKIGYAPKEYGRLENILLKKGFKEDFLIESGLFSKGNNGLKTLFFDRVMFPIFNYRYECIGFGGRALNNEIKPKYINSPETVLYKKSYNLYGINNAKEHIQKNKKVFIVEGYVDVISCYKNDLRNIVAPCGTAITNGQIKLLSRYANEIVLLLDGDEAGLKGVGKALRETANIENIKTSVLVIPDGMDPDDYFKKYTLDDFYKFEEKKLDGFDFLVFFKSRNFDKKDYRSLTEILDYLFDYINLWENEIVRKSFIERISYLLDIDKAMLEREFIIFQKGSKYSQKEVNKNDFETRTTKNKEPDESLKREIDLIIILTLVDNRLNLIKQLDLKDIYFNNEISQKLFSNLLLAENFEMRNFIDLIDDDIIKNYVNDKIFSDELKQNEIVLINNIIDRITNLIHNYYLKLNEDLNEKIKLSELYKDDEQVKSLQEEKTINVKQMYFKKEKLQELKK